MVRQSEHTHRTTRGQAWSIDLIIGVVIFMLVIATFYAFMSSRTELSLDELKAEGNVITSRLLVQGAEESLLTATGQLSLEKYNELCTLEYSAVKAKLGVAGDVCIFLEDENGNIIQCENDRVGIGNAKDINLSENIICGQFLS